MFEPGQHVGVAVSGGADPVWHPPEVRQEPSPIASPYIVAGTMLSRIAETIRRHRMFEPGQHVGVAVSGGADSVWHPPEVRQKPSPITSPYNSGWHHAFPHRRNHPPPSHVEPGQHVGVAVSGGADSVCLLHVLLELAPQWNLRVSVLHLNHGLRGEESLADEQFVRELAARLGMPATVRSQPVGIGR